jgi:hypothetical protein
MGRDFDYIRQMRLWMIAINIASPRRTINEIDQQAKRGS